MQTSTAILPARWQDYMTTGSTQGLPKRMVAECDRFCATHGYGYAVSVEGANGASNESLPKYVAFKAYEVEVLTPATQAPAPVKVAGPKIKISKEGRKLLRKEITTRQASLPALPAGIKPDPANAGTHRWPISGLKAGDLLVKATAMGITDFSPFGPNSKGAQPVTQAPTPVTPAPAPVTPAPTPVTPAPTPVTPAPSGPAPQGATRLEATKVFGLKFKALKGLMVDVWPVGHHSHVPAVDPNMYLGYDDGKLLAEILHTLNRVQTRSESDKYLSNQWLMGHRGTGKSAMIKQVAAMLRRPLHVISIKPTTTIAELLGDYDTRSVGQGESSQLWIDGKFTKAIKTPHAIVVLDEYSRGTQLGVSLNGPLQDRVLQILETGTDIPFAEGVNMVVTDNNAGVADDDGVYDGTDMDVSQIERWPNQFEFDYLPRRKEIGVLQKLTGVPEHTASMIVDVAGVARASAGTDLGDPRFRPSLRLMQSWALALMEGRDTTRSFKQTMLIGLPAETKEAGLVILHDQVSPTVLKDGLAEPPAPEDTPEGEDAKGDDDNS